MSLYDMYFSKKNKNHIFNIITEYVIKETSIDINSEQDYIDLYRFKYPLIFERSLSDNLIDLNKELIDEIVPLYINDITSKRKTKNIKVITENNENNETNVNNDMTSDILKKVPNNKKQIYINSCDRVKESINRYDYNITLKDNISLLTLEEIMLPEENNILFENPIICIQIINNNETYNIFCSYEKNINLKNTNFTVYKPSKLLEFPIKNNDLNIKILTNTLNQILTYSDKMKINKIKEINYLSEKYLCLSIDSDNISHLKNDETICIYSEDKLIKICKINMIKDKFILIQNEIINYHKDKNYYLLINRLQNDLVFLYE